jgi:CxxC motif-containing protein (DUF1111 family)
MNQATPAALAALLLLGACNKDPLASDPGEALQSPRIEQRAAALSRPLSGEALPGGGTSQREFNLESAQALSAFSRPAANLGVSERRQFAVGNSFFSLPWISAPASTSARDGLGPLFAAAACQDCHVRDGRGHPPADANDELQAAVVRLARPDGSIHPVYGEQLQNRALPGHAPEARPRVFWEEQELALPDGTAYRLRRPRLELGGWGYGDPGPLRTSLRVAPPMIGLGLLGAIPEQELLRQEAAQAKLGLRGRLNRAADGSIGRFGWKAAQPSVAEQIAAAFAQDIGITSIRRPSDACTAAQQACRNAPQGGRPELGPAVEAALVFYSRHLAVPARRDHEVADVQAGRQTFSAIGCAACHRPQWHTGASDSAALAGQQIWPYTDLLLHDLGEGLADGVPEHRAGRQHWRTAPLWGLQHAQSVGGAKMGFLHDGRARSLAEAILWHGGEASASRDAWVALPREERRRLIRFLASL